MLEYFERIDKLASRSRRIPNVTACSDMLTMCDATHKIAVALSKELVECRRKNKLSPKSSELLTKLDESIVNIEKMLTYATLMHPKK
jgi:hypothetical protein